MVLTKSKTLMRDIREANPDWFTRGNKAFFNDVSYRAYYGKKSGKAYLIRSTYAWSDMFGQPRRLQWRINDIDQDTLKILPVTDDTFNDIYEVKAWLRSQ